MNAKTVWKSAAEDFPANGTVVQKLAHILRLTTQASAMDDWRPCQYKLKDSCIELFTVSDPETEAGDSDDRDVTIGCGAALFRLKLALKNFGCLGPVDLFPDLGNTRQVARIHYGCWLSPDAREIAMFEAMTGATKNFTPFGEALISEAAHGSLKQAIACENAWLEFSHSESNRKRLADLAHADGPAASPDEFESSGDSNVDARQSWSRWAVPLPKFNERFGRARENEYLSRSPSAEDMPALAVLKTKTDDKQGWLAAGLTRACVQLQAQASGMSSSFFDRPFRTRFLREELRTAIGHKGFLQAVVGLASQAENWQPAIPARSSVTITLRR